MPDSEEGFPMRIGFSILVLAGVSLFSGCMISEQIGRMPQDFTIHFDTDFNRILLFGRSLALAVLAVWLYHALRKTTAATVVSVVVFGVAAWLFIMDYPALSKYRIEIQGEGLVLNIPPDPEAFIAWDTIETLQLAGYEWATVPMPEVVDRFMPKSDDAFSSLPDWETMDITAGGARYHIVVKKLSVEQRQILSRAIVHRGHLVQE
jgi:hypothetical protein